MPKNPLIPKKGVDKNGRAYTRLVRPEGADDNSRVKRVPGPVIYTEQQVVDEGIGYDERLETSESVLASIPRKYRANITPEQLDSLFNIMVQFGTRDNDTQGFRRYFASTEEYHHEWSERGYGSRLTHVFDRDGNLRDIHFYSISDYRENTEYPRYYRAQAEMRKIFGLPEYNESEIAHLAKKYWEINQFPILGDIPRDGAIFLREQYVRDILSQPHLINDILDELEKNPVEKVGNISTYVNVYGSDRNEKEIDRFNELVEKGDIKSARYLVDDLGLNRDKRDLVYQKLDAIAKDIRRQKREAKKAAEAEG